MPIRAALFGNAQAALVERLKRGFDGVTGFAFGRGRDGVARLPCGVDGGFKGGVGHRGFSSVKRFGWL